MKRLIIAATALAVGSGQALALTCPNPGSPASVTPDTSAQIRTLLATGNSPCVNSATCSGTFALYGTFPNNNTETLTGGSVYDYKEGNSTRDPAAKVGTYSITTSGGHGNIQYTYGNKPGVYTGGGTYTYCVYGTSNPGTVYFYNGSVYLTVTIQAGQ
jgi:hypothetical protein